MSGALIPTGRRRLLAALGTVALLPVLAGCDSHEALYSNSIEIQLIAGGGLAVVVCHDIQLVTGLGSVRYDQSGNWLRFWDAEGDEFIPGGTVAEFGDLPFGLSAVADDVPDIRPGSELDISLYGSHIASGQETFTIEDPAAVVGMWLDSDGEVSATPCT